jgi:hypothetical protein
MEPHSLESYVDAAAACIGLPIAPAHRPGVVTYFRIAHGMAQQVFGVPLDAHDDPAPVFIPVSPDERA